MPVTARKKLEAVASDLGGQARVARILGVSASRVSRWLRTEQPDAENKRRVEGLEFVMSRLLSVFDKRVAEDWLFGFNEHLGGRRPVDLVIDGRVAEVLSAIDAHEIGTYA